jgi:dTDP-4-amino-4,6-dideoxygalactose transaminase/ribosomal protein S18 acetylase RimI-like enzyme
MMSGLDDFRHERMGQEHLQQVVAIHEECFPRYYLTSLGPSFLRAMYSWHVQDPEAIAHAALDRDGLVVGFVAGTKDDSNYRRSLFRRTWWRMAGALGQRFISKPVLALRLMCERQDLIWQALATILTRRSLEVEDAGADSDRELPTASLVSIGVKPSIRRSGLGTALSELFVKEARDRGCGKITLSVREGNVGARRFYESMNWEEVSRSSKAYHGSFSITYQKIMNDQQEEEKTPVREEFLPPLGPCLGEEEWNEVMGTLQSGWITMGPKTKRFEELFAEYVGSRHAIAVSSCTAGLHLALVAGEIGPGDEVITTPLTFCSTANVIVHQGALPVLADVRIDTMNIDPEKIRSKITPRTKVIIPVHLGGQPCEMDEIRAIAEERELLVVEDAAHATGAKYKGEMIGTMSEVTVFSFYATKNLTTGEGGMITTEDEELAGRMRILRLHGISADAWKRYSALGSWYYEVLYPGYKYNMTDIQASLGIHQLAKQERFLEVRQRYVEMYTDAFKDLPAIATPVVKDYVRHAWHLYTIRLDLERLTIDRAQFIEALRKQNIGTSVHFIPLHLHPYYRGRYGFKKGDFPVAESVYESIVTLPLYPKMSVEDVEDVIQAVRKVVAESRR